MRNYRFLSLILALVMVLTLFAACGNTEKDYNNDFGGNATGTTGATETTDKSMVTEPQEVLPEENPAEATTAPVVVPSEPEETVPVENAPEATVPEEVIPEETVPATAPAESVPDETHAEEHAPTESAPAEDALPDPTVPMTTPVEEAP